MQEEWKPISGYEGRYEVSNYGRVKSVAKNGLIMAQVKDTYGYVVVSLGYPKVMKKVHRLVALAFIENPLCKPQVNHLDNKRDNNVLTNLEWVTHKENTEYMDYQGRRKTNPYKCPKTGRFVSKS